MSDPSASLAEVAAAAGIGRTTLHKQYATRDDLMRAVAHRALDRWAEAVSSADEIAGPDGGLLALVTAMIPIGPHLTFLWRTPAFDRDEVISKRWIAMDPAVMAVLIRAQDAGVIRRDVPGWWLLQTLYSVVYVAAESVGPAASRRATRLPWPSARTAMAWEPRSTSATTPHGSSR